MDEDEDDDDGCDEEEEEEEGKEDEDHKGLWSIVVGTLEVSLMFRF